MIFEIDDAKVNYEVDGPEDAPVVLHWNGAACTLRMWDSADDLLTPHFRCLRFDARGVGESSPAEDPDAGYTFERYSADVNAILDAFGIRGVHLFSMAWGSRGAIAYASMYPERVLSAGFYDANLKRADVDAQKAGHTEALRRQRAAGVAEFPAIKGVKQHGFPDEVPKAMAAAGKFDFQGATDKLKMPVLLATGDCDPNLPFTREIAAAVPHARFVEMKNVGHGSVIQRPDLTTEIFLDFHRSLGTIS